MLCLHNLRRHGVIVLVVWALLGASCTADPQIARSAAVDAPPVAEPPTHDIHPDWDPLLVDLVGFVQNTFDEQFSRPAQIEFMTPADLAQEIGGDRPELSQMPDRIRTAIAHVDDFHRALGLAANDYDLSEQRRQLDTQIFAWYNPGSNLVIMTSADGERPDHLDVPTRAVAVHELTHALQGTGYLTRLQGFTDEIYARAVAEGQAEWALGQYVAQLPPAERAQWLAFVTNRRVPIKDVEPILQANLAAPYPLGHRLHLVLAQSGGTESFSQLGDGFKASNRTSRALIDPFRWDIQSETPWADAELPTGPEVDPVALDETGIRLGPLDWFQVFAAVVEPSEALRSARTLTSVSVPAAWIVDSRLCFNANITTDQPDTTGLASTLQSWARAEPTRSVKDAAEDGFALSGCDPDPEAPPALLDPFEALEWLATHIDAELWLVETDQDSALAYCVVEQVGDMATSAGFDRQSAVDLFEQADLSIC